MSGTHLFLRNNELRRMVRLVHPILRSLAVLFPILAVILVSLGAWQNQNAIQQATSKEQRLRPYSLPDGNYLGERDGPPLSIKSILGPYTLENIQRSYWIGSGNIAIPVDSYLSASNKKLFVRDKLANCPLAGFQTIDSDVKEALLNPKHYSSMYSPMSKCDNTFDSVIHPKRTGLYLLFNTRNGICAVIDQNSDFEFIGRCTNIPSLALVAYIRPYCSNTTWHVGLDEIIDER